MGEVGTRKPLDGRYQLLTEVDGGSADRLWQAWDERRRRPVVVRLLAEEPELYEKVARTVAVLSDSDASPHLVTAHGHGRFADDDGTGCFLVMDRVSGQRLSRAVAREQPALTMVLAWGAQLCAALAAMHTAGLAHGAVTPGNIILKEDGTLTLLGPHIAASSEPEPAADLYALGCLLYTLVTGRQHENGEPEPTWRHAPRVPQRLDHLILELLDQDPERRPSDARTVAGRLRAIAEGPLPQSARPPESADPASTREQGGSRPGPPLRFPGFGSGGPEAPKEPEDTSTSAPVLAAVVLTTASVWVLLTVFTELGVLAVAGVTALALVALAAAGVTTVEVEREDEAGAKKVGCGMLLAVVAAGVAAGAQLSLSWWAMVLLVPVLAVGVGAGVSLGYLVLCGAALGVYRKYRYPLVARAWAVTACVLIAVLACGAVGFSGYASWGMAALWALGAWTVSGIVLGLVLIRLRER